MRELRNLIHIQLRASANATDVCVVLTLISDLTEVAQAVHLSSSLGDDHSQIARLVVEMRHILHRWGRRGDLLKAVDWVFRSRSKGYAKASDEDREHIRNEVSTLLRIELGPPLKIPGSVRLPRSKRALSTWPELIDLGIRTANKRGPPRKSEDLPEPAAVMQAVLTAWNLNSNSIEALRHARKPSSRRKKV